MGTEQRQIQGTGGKAREEYAKLGGDFTGERAVWEGKFNIE